MYSTYCKVHIFWEDHTILRNLHRRFDWHWVAQIYGGDFAKFCGLLRKYELYLNWQRQKWFLRPITCKEGSLIAVKNSRNISRKKVCYFKNVFTPSSKLFVTYHWLLVHILMPESHKNLTHYSEQNGKE